MYIDKAFDYTWREGMFYNLWQRGVRRKIWKVMQNLCQDQDTKREIWTKKRN